MTSQDKRRRDHFTRRDFLRGSAATTSAALLLGHISSSVEASSPIAATEPFLGIHQAGILTPAQESLAFAALDLAPQSLTNLRDVFRTLTQAAVDLTAGKPAGLVEPGQRRVPADTGEAAGSGASGLTITFGIGRSAFVQDGVDVLGLAKNMPSALQPLPTFSRDRLDPTISDGDMCIQACSDNSQVAFHAVHTLSHLIAGAADMRWLQLGFGRTSSTSRGQRTPRNLMGFKDGTDNVKADDTAVAGKFVWVGNEGPKWLRSGCYLVARRIEIDIEKWDQQELHEQEHTIGRSKLSGAPLGGHKEFDPVNLTARKNDGSFVIPPDAHIRVASPHTNQGRYLLRRG